MEQSQITCAHAASKIPRDLRTYSEDESVRVLAWLPVQRTFGLESDVEIALSDVSTFHVSPVQVWAIVRRFGTPMLLEVLAIVSYKIVNTDPKFTYPAQPGCDGPSSTMMKGALSRSWRIFCTFNGGAS